MKKSSLSLLIFWSLLVLFVPQGSAQQTYKYRLPAKDEPIYGTWINPSYEGWAGANAQKWVFLNWGYGRLYNLVADENPSYDWTFTPVEKWAGTDGSTWYKLFMQDKDGREYFLARVSPDRAELEFVRGAGFPDESDLTPANGTFRSFRRQ